jgi:hypothetical protein
MTAIVGLPAIPLLKRGRCRGCTPSGVFRATGGLRNLRRTPCSIFAFVTMRMRLVD